MFPKVQQTVDLEEEEVENAEKDPHTEDKEEEKVNSFIFIRNAFLFILCKSTLCSALTKTGQDFV